MLKKSLGLICVLVLALNTLVWAEEQKLERFDVGKIQGQINRVSVAYSPTEKQWSLIFSPPDKVLYNPDGQKLMRRSFSRSFFDPKMHVLIFLPESKEVNVEWGGLEEEQKNVRASVVEIQEHLLKSYFGHVENWRKQDFSKNYIALNFPTGMPVKLLWTTKDGKPFFYEQ